MNAKANNIHVLHVDDEPDFGAMAAEFLEREDDRIAVQTATNTQEGLEQFADSDIDCIVSDFNMPGQNGIEFLETIRENFPELPFILYTGKGSEEVASEAINAGVTKYMQKESGTEQYEILANDIVSSVQKHRTEQELDQLRRQYTKLVEQNFVGIYIIQDGEFVYVNPRLAAIHGYDNPEEIIGLSPLDLIAPEERDRVQTKIAQRLAGEKREIQYQTVGLRQDGERIDIELHGSRVEYKGDMAIIGAELDITQGKERERKLSEEKEKYATLVEQSHDGILVLQDGEIKFVNEQSTDILGFEEPELLGKSIFDFIAPQYRDRLRDRYRRRLDPESESPPAQYDVHFLPKEGEQRIANVSAASIQYEGEPAALAAVRDITERRERERDLRREKDRLDDFASLVSHDLRNPLNVALGRVNLAQDDCDTDHLDAAVDGIERSLDLIEDMLELARTGQEVSEVEPIEMATLVDACWDTVVTTDAELKIDSGATIQGDRTRLRQLLENLFRNAVEHGADDVTVRVGFLPDGFYVEDDGPGIPESEREDVWEAGYSKTAEGTGFGLSIVQQIVKAHDWDIRITEGSEGGARFEITGVPFAAK